MSAKSAFQVWDTKTLRTHAIHPNRVGPGHARLAPHPGQFHVAAAPPPRRGFDERYNNFCRSQARSLGGELLQEPDCDAAGKQRLP